MSRTKLGAQSRSALLNADDLARLLGTTPKAIRAAIAKNRTYLIPPSFTLGRRRVWLRETVEQWLRQRASKQPPQYRRGVQSMGVPKIVEGLELVDDEGGEVTVIKVSEKKATVTLETADGGTYSMALRELRSKLNDGEFGCVVDDEDDEDIDDADDDDIDDADLDDEEDDEAA